MQSEQQVKEWAAKQFGIKPEEVLWYHGGSCYDRVGVSTKEAADRVTKSVDGQTANGGFYHGMPLGAQTKIEGGFDVTC